MKTSKNEQNKKYSRFSNSIRSICLTLICSFILCSNSIYASSINTDVGQGTYDSIIVNNDGTIDHTATTNFRGIIGNIVSFLQKINRNEYQNGTYLATIYTYFSSALSDIRTYSQNTAAATNAALQLMGDQVNIDWKNSTAQYIGVYDPNGNLLNNDTTYSFSDYYIAFTGFHNDRDSITKVNIPLSAWSGNPYVKSVSVYSGVGTGKVSELYYFVETSASTGLNVYFTPAMPYSAVYIRVTVNGNFHTITPGLSYIQYIPNTSEDYFKIYDFIIQYNLLQKDSNINVEINDSINVTPIDLDVQIGINDFTEVNTISNKLRTWLSTGVGVSALIGALDQLDDSFFTLHNRNIIETINSGYTDFYD